jgi:hypothetical protein
MSFLGPLAASIAGPLIGSLAGKIFHTGSGRKRLGGSAMIGGMCRTMPPGMVGGRRRRRGGSAMIGGRRRVMRGEGWFTDLLSKALKVGKKAYALSQDKRVRGLVKHGVNTYKNLREERRKEKEKEAAITPMASAAKGKITPNGKIAGPSKIPRLKLTGHGRRGRGMMGGRRRRGHRMRGRRHRRGGAMLYNSSSNSAGPLP